MLKESAVLLTDVQTAPRARFTSQCLSGLSVSYRPETERASHYFQARLSPQFDAVLHFDQTRAVEPLERAADWEAGEVPETFLTGI